MKPLSREVVQKVLATVDAGLSAGLGKREPGEMCVEAAVCYALGLPHGDDPPCVGNAVRAYKIQLNDSRWSSNKARAAGMRRVALAQLGSDRIDQKEFREEVVLGTVKTLLPLALRAVAKVVPSHAPALEISALACGAVTEFAQARDVAKSAGKVARAAYDDAYDDACADACATAAADAAVCATADYAAVCATADYADACATAAADYADACATAADAAVCAAADAYAYADAAADAAAYDDACAADAAAAYAAAAYADACAAAYAARDGVLGKAAEIAVQALVKLGCEGTKWLDLAPLTNPDSVVP